MSADEAFDQSILEELKNSIANYNERDNEHCFDCVKSEACFNCRDCTYCYDCGDCRSCLSCENCISCFGCNDCFHCRACLFCTGLRGTVENPLKYHIFNVEVSKEEYLQKLAQAKKLGLVQPIASKKNYLNQLEV